MGDRNFDDLADHFEQRIYGSSKGELRQAIIWRDLKAAIPAIDQTDNSRPLRILDVGAGLGYFSTTLSQLGHAVTFNDLSVKMTKKAQAQAIAKGVGDQIQWHVGPYQNLQAHKQDGFDLVLCHALLEWLEKPQDLIPTLAVLLKPKGILSFCFYNQAGIVYRNLIKGNFNWINNQENYQADKNSLTPQNPCSFDQVSGWLAASGLVTGTVSGIRVFSDYTVNKQGGLNSPESVFDMELKFSQLEPYMWLGRYLHVIARLA